MNVGVGSLSELPARLCQAVLLSSGKVGSGATFEKAEILARCETRFAKRSMEYKGLIKSAVE